MKNDGGMMEFPVTMRRQREIFLLQPADSKLRPAKPGLYALAVVGPALPSSDQHYHH